MKVKNFDCECYCDSHLMKWTLIEGCHTFPPRIELSIFLNNNMRYVVIPFIPTSINTALNVIVFSPLYRFWNAAQYVLGIKNKHGGHFDTFEINRDSVKELIELLNELVE